MKRGEVLGIIGRNGAGKSTLLKILSRVTEPTQGRVTIKGRVASLLEVGTGFHPELTGRENIYLNGAILGMSRGEIRRKFNEIVAFAEIEKFLDTPVKRYSSGMYVRLAFAVAAHLEPEILLIDEVLAVGDSQFQSKCLGKMSEVARAGRTVLFVSHNMAAVRHLCGRLLMLHEGFLVGDGDPAKVSAKYFADASANGIVLLHDWKDRSTNKEGQIISFELLDECGNHASSVLLGGKIRFVFTVEFHRAIVRPLFGVFVHTIAGEPLLDLRSSHDGLRVDKASGRVTVEAVIDEVGLYPGEYTLSPWVWDDNSRIDIDWVRHCCKLRVLPAPGLHGDLRLDPTQGKYFVPSSWSLFRGSEGNVLGAVEPTEKSN